MCRVKGVAWSHAVTSAIRLSSAPTTSLPASAIVLAMSITRAPSASLSFSVRPSAEHRPDEPTVSTHEVGRKAFGNVQPSRTRALHGTLWTLAPKRNAYQA